jgi:hypothetical protein
MSFTIGTLATGVQGLLNGRTQYNNTLAEYATKGALELQENYKFAELQTSGPVVQLVPLQAVYSPNFFLAPADSGLMVNKINSFFIYNNPYAPLSNVNDQNSGYNLIFSTIDNIEVLINIPGIPVKWTRFENDIWIGSVPDQPYSIYARYQHENPFPNRGTSNANNDTIFMPSTWQDIMEYVTAMRIARDLNLASKANELFTALYGDKQFQLTSGMEGSPGLIFQRTSQENRDQTTSTKSLRIRMGRQ